MGKSKKSFRFLEEKMEGECTRMKTFLFIFKSKQIFSLFGIDKKNNFVNVLIIFSFFFVQR